SDVQPFLFEETLLFGDGQWSHVRELNETKHQFRFLDYISGSSLRSRSRCLSYRGRCSPTTGCKYQNGDDGTRRCHEPIVCSCRFHSSALSFLVVNNVGLKLIIAHPQVGVFPSATPFTSSSESV